MAPQKPTEVDVAQDSQFPDAAALVAAFVAAPDDALTKGNTVCEVTTLSASTRDRQVLAGTFPKPLKFGTRCKRWRVGDVRTWLAAQSSGLGQWAPSTQAADAAKRTNAVAVTRDAPIDGIQVKRGPGRPRKHPIVVEVTGAPA
jgi:predicted DNA-binding transcriptional regulator AlpA